jgi:hypothetical protein
MWLLSKKCFAILARENVKHAMLANLVSAHVKIPSNRSHKKAYFILKILNILPLWQ